MTLRITKDMDPERALWIDTGIPPRYRRESVAALLRATVLDPERRAPYVRTSAWLATLNDQQRLDSLGIPLNDRQFGRGLLFAGPPGTGKTTLACAVACDVRRTKRSVFFTSWPEYVNAARFLIGMNHESDQAEIYRASRIIDRAVSAFLVVLDDVGHEHTTGTHYAEDRLSDLLKERFRAGRPTAITTNLTGDDWRARYSPALRSFMDEATVLVPVTGPDRRGRDAQG